MSTCVVKTKTPLLLVTPFVVMKPRQRRAEAACVCLSLAADVSGFVAPQPTLARHCCHHASLALSLNRASPVQPPHQPSSPRSFVRENCNVAASWHGAFRSSSIRGRGLVHAGPLSMGATGEENSSKQGKAGDSSRVCRDTFCDIFLLLSSVCSVHVCACISGSAMT